MKIEKEESVYNCINPLNISQKKFWNKGGFTIFFPKNS